MLGGSLGVQDEVEANGGGSSGGVLYVSEAIRTLPNQGERRCAPQPKVKTQTSEIGDNPAQLRGRGAVQDTSSTKQWSWTWSISSSWWGW